MISLCAVAGWPSLDGCRMGKKLDDLIRKDRIAKDKTVFLSTVTEVPYYPSFILTENPLLPLKVYHNLQIVRLSLSFPCFIVLVPQRHCEIYEKDRDFSRDGRNIKLLRYGTCCSCQGLLRCDSAIGRY